MPILAPPYGLGGTGSGIRDPSSDFDGFDRFVVFPRDVQSTLKRRRSQELIWKS